MCGGPFEEDWQSTRAKEGVEGGVWGREVKSWEHGDFFQRPVAPPKVEGVGPGFCEPPLLLAEESIGVEKIAHF